MPSPELHEPTQPPTPDDPQRLEGLARVEPQLALARQLYGDDGTDDVMLMRWSDEGYAKVFSDLYVEDDAFRRMVREYQRHGTPDVFAVIKTVLDKHRLH